MVLPDPSSPAAFAAGPSDLARRRCRRVLVDKPFSKGTSSPSIDRFGLPGDRREIWESGLGGLLGTGGGITASSIQLGEASIWFAEGMAADFDGGGGRGVGLVGIGGRLLDS